MSFVCSICQDCLSERPQALNGDGELVLCALNCGHLFHRICVQQWFNGIGGCGNGHGTCPQCKAPSSLTQALRIFPTGDEDSDLVDEENKNLRSLIAENQKLELELREAKDELNMSTEDNEALRLDLERAIKKSFDLKLKFDDENQGLESDLKIARSELSTLKSVFEEKNGSLRKGLTKAKDELSNLQSIYEDESAAHENLKIRQAELLSTLDSHQDQFAENREMNTALENSVKTAVEKAEKEKRLAMILLSKFQKRNKALLEEMEILIRTGKNEQELFFEAAAAHGLGSLDSNTATSSENITRLIESLYLLQEDQDA